MTDEKWSHLRMLQALENGENLPVGRWAKEWEHNAPVLDDLLHDGFARGPKQNLHDGSGAYFDTSDIRLTDLGRKRLRELEQTDSPAESIARAGFDARVAEPTGRAGFDARVLTVLIASPGDTADARDAVEQAILSWNRDRSHRERVVLLPIRWEADAVPEMGSDGQSIINRQLVDRADIVIALFHSRVGAPTPRAESGTAEEIERASAKGVAVHVYFAEQPHPYEVDPDELKRLQAFREKMRQRGLLGRYVSSEDLIAQVRTALERDVARLVTATPSGPDTNLPVGPGAVLRARFEARYGKSDDRLIIENVGDGPASNVEVSLDAIGQGQAPEMIGDLPIETLLPGTGYSLLLVLSLASAAQFRVRMTWQESGEEYDQTQSVSSF